MFTRSALGKGWLLRESGVHQPTPQAFLENILGPDPVKPGMQHEISAQPSLQGSPSAGKGRDNCQRDEEEIRQQRGSTWEEGLLICLDASPKWRLKGAMPNLNAFRPGVGMGSGLPLYILIQPRDYRATRIKAKPQGKILIIYHPLSPGDSSLQHTSQGPTQSQQSTEGASAETPDSPLGSPHFNQIFQSQAVQT